MALGEEYVSLPKWRNDHRARVTQVLRLLKLSLEVLKAITALGDSLPSPIVTERRLRPIVNLPEEEQKRRVNIIYSSNFASSSDLKSL